MGLLDKAKNTIDKVTGAVSGRSGAEAALEGATLQAEAGRAAIRAQQEQLAQSRQDLLPFQQVGLASISPLEQALGSLPGTPEQRGINPQVLGGQGLLGAGTLNRRAGSTSAFGQQGREQLGGEVFQGGFDPNVLNDPFFQARQAEATRGINRGAAARGKFGAGQTAKDIARTSLILGSQQAQQALDSDRQAQGQRFGQLQQAIGTGLGAAQTGFDQTQSGINFGLLGQGNQFDLASQAGQDFNAINQQGFGNQLDLQGQLVNQLQGLTGLGQAAAAGQAAQTLNTGQDITNTLTGIGNAQAAGGIGAANALGQGSQNIAELGTSIAGAFQKPPEQRPVQGLI